MTLKDTVHRCLINQPSIFENAFDVYHHLFCVLGNGYKWKNGELVCGNDNVVTVDEGIIEYLKSQLLEDWHLDLIRKSVKNGTEKRHFKKVIDTVQQILKVHENENDFTIHNPFALNTDIKFELYPLCHLSKIVTFPDNIKPDWFEGIKRMAKIMEDNTEYLTENDIEWLGKVKEKITEHEIKKV